MDRRHLLSTLVVPYTLRDRDMIVEYMGRRRKIPGLQSYKEIGMPTYILLDHYNRIPLFSGCGSIFADDSNAEHITYDVGISEYPHPTIAYPVSWAKLPECWRKAFTPVVEALLG